MAALALATVMSGCLTRRIVYPAPGVPVGPPPEGCEEVSIPLPSGRQICAWAHAGREAPPGGPVILFFHGNGENLETVRLSGTLAELESLDLPFLAVDYPGYGRSGGAPSEASLLESADASVSWLRRRHPARPIAAFGWSMGAAVAVQAALRNPGDVKALVIASSWTSLPEVARLHFPGWLVWLLLRDRYDSLAAAPAIQVPCLLVHGADDDLILRDMGRRLARALPQARLVQVAGAGHNDLLGHAEAWSAVRDFLAAR